MRYLFYYLLSINIISFICMGLDKFRASRDRWRIPERTLFLLAAAGGSIGSIAGMFLFRHKTKHLSFRIELPAILILQCAAAFLIWRSLSGR